MSESDRRTVSGILFRRTGRERHPRRITVIRRDCDKIEHRVRTALQGTADRIV